MAFRFVQYLERVQSVQDTTLTTLSADTVTGFSTCLHYENYAES